MQGRISKLTLQTVGLHLVNLHALTNQANAHWCETSLQLVILVVNYSCCPHLRNNLENYSCSVLVPRSFIESQACAQPAGHDEDDDKGSGFTEENSLNKGRAKSG